MEPALEILPLFLYIFISLKLQIALGILIAVLAVGRDKVSEEEGVDTLAQIILAHGYQHKVDHVIAAVDSFEYMIPSEREQLARRTAQRLGK